MELRYGIQLQYNAGLEVDYVEPWQPSLVAQNLVHIVESMRNFKK